MTAGLADVRARIASTGRDPSDVRVVAMTKGFGSEAVAAAVAAGLRDCGENYAQALLAKVDGAPDGTRWHFLGPVQRNKVKRLAPHVAVWQGIDREAAAVEVARHRPGAAVLVQVNLAGDAARPGCGWDDVATLVARCLAAGLDVQGLMGVAVPRPVLARSQFRRLASVAAELGLPELSMGMSADLEVAVEEGATTVRIGTALFGARPGTAAARR
ncbi:MAG TPA: YggS family pyridoxal phosphate-dependent enzyme [Acidimicrobiales bacterium]|nr:YggS family pyridoxal phosphate-dependent enzyme [Acidimicrobiales bacterium]